MSASGVGLAAGVGGISGTKTDTEQSHEGNCNYIKDRQRIQDLDWTKIVVH